VNQKKDKHHFISQFYLRGFATPTKQQNKDSPHLTNVLDVKRARQFRANVRDVAFQKYFNRLENYKEHANELEDSLMVIEGRLSNSIEQLSNSKTVDEGLADALVNLMALFGSRTPMGRERIKSHTKSVEDAVHYALGNFPHMSENRSDGVTFDMLNQAYRDGEMKNGEYTQDQLIQTEFVLVRDLVRDLHKRTWHLLDCAACSSKFITSDNPVVLCHREKGLINLHFTGSAVLDKRAVIYFPVTSTLALYGVLDGSEAPVVNEYTVSNLNTWMVNNGCRQIFYKEKNFNVVDANGEAQTDEDVFRVVKRLLEDELKNQSKEQDATLGILTTMNKDDFRVMNVQDVIAMLESEASRPK